jgi:hypothetical protein
VFVGAWLSKRKQHLEAGRDGQSHKHAMFGLQHHYTATVLNSNGVRLCMRCGGEHAVETQITLVFSGPPIYLLVLSIRQTRPTFHILDFRCVYFGGLLLWNKTLLTLTKNLSGIYQPRASSQC